MADILFSTGQFIYSLTMLNSFILCLCGVQKPIKYINSTVAKRGSVFIGFMTLAGAIWSRYQRTFLMRCLSYIVSAGSHKEAPKE